MLPKWCFRRSWSCRHWWDDAVEGAVVLPCLTGQPLFPLSATVVRKLSFFCFHFFFCVKISYLTKYTRSF